MRISAISSDPALQASRARDITRLRGFDSALAGARSRAYVVRRGDTLSEVVQAHFASYGKRVSNAELYAGVKRVARANGLPDANLIRVGQEIDLSALDTQGASAPRPSRATFDAELVTANARVSSSYGLRRDPLNGTIRFHRGIDIAAPKGNRISPIAPGEVVFAGWHGGHGKTVIVRHRDGTETLYGHADKLMVRRGERVDSDSTLGLVGSTGRSTGPHIHFEVRRDGKAVSPSRYLRSRARFL